MARPRTRAYQWLKISVGAWLALLLMFAPFLHEHLGSSSVAGWHWHLHLGQTLPVDADPVDQQLSNDSTPGDGATIGIDTLLERPAQEIPDTPIAHALPFLLLLVLLLAPAGDKPRALLWPRRPAPRHRHSPGLPPQALAPPRP
ncbi:hypothetical protein ACSSZE_06600 [Acidithiobacillus caldus]